MPLQPPVVASTQAGQIITNSFVTANWTDSLQFLLAPPLAILTQSATQTIANTTATAVNWDAEVIDTYNGHSTVTNNSRYTVQAPGWYSVNTTLDWGTNGTGNRILYVYLNGTQIPYAYVSMGAVTGNSTGHAIQTVVQCAIGDYLETWAYQTSGGGLNLGPSNCATMISWIHA